jgi:hypothetical protein
MADSKELAGMDVILVHRLLKNAVNERLNGRPYALYTDACVKAMGIDPATQDIIQHLEIRVGKPDPKDLPFLQQAGVVFQKNITDEFENLRKILEGQVQSPLAVEEPAMPASQESLR